MAKMKYSTFSMFYPVLLSCIIIYLFLISLYHVVPFI